MNATIIESSYPARAYDVHQPFVIVKHRDYWGFTWYYPTNRNGHVCTSGHPMPEPAQRQIDLMS